MIYLIALLLFFPVTHTATYDEPTKPSLEEISKEVNGAVDNFFELLDEQDMDVFLAGVRHAARAELLIERYLEINLSEPQPKDSFSSNEDYNLWLIGLRVRDLASDAGRELWRQDPDDKQWALFRLVELESMKDL